MLILSKLIIITYKYAVISIAAINLKTAEIKLITMSRELSYNYID